MLVFSRHTISHLKNILSNIYIPGGLRLWLTIFSLSFIGYAINNNIDELLNLKLNNDSFFWLFIGFIASLASLYLNAYAWKILISWLRYKAIGVKLIPLFLKTNILKYAPGGVWHFVERVRSLKSSIGIRKSILSIILEPVLMLVSSSFCIAFGPWGYGYSFICLLPFLVFINPFRDKLISRFEKIQIKKLQSYNVDIPILKPDSSLDLRRQNYPLKPLIIEIAFILVRFSGFWFCLKAFNLDIMLPIHHWLSFFSLAWSVGLIVPAAPGGIGVFEFVLFSALGSEAQGAALLGVLLCYRTISSLSDVSAALLSRLI